MNLTFIGAGYVGLVTAVGFASKGISVCCVDTDNEKIEKINQGIAPIFEKDLTSSLQGCLQNKKIWVTSSLSEGLKFADTIFIAVGTPPKSDGSADMRFVNQVLDEILLNLNRDMIIVNKSTVPVGTANLMKKKIQSFLTEHQLSFKVDVISNPEFLREGEALHDFLYPDRIVIGGDSEDVMQQIADLYIPFVNDRSQILLMDNASAEMTKYAANTMLAARISFMNEISRLCEETGANVDYVRRGIGTDTRIGPLFLKAGIGYGGSCFPKDIDALLFLGKSLSASIPLIKAIKDSNVLQRAFFISKIETILGSLAGKKLAIWGLAFKSETDDVRDSPALLMIRELHEKGVKSFQAYDKEAIPMAKIDMGEDFPMTYMQDLYSPLQGQDALIIMTDSSEFLGFNIEKAKKMLSPLIIFDGRNILDPEKMKDEGVHYYSIGRVE